MSQFISIELLRRVFSGGYDTTNPKFRYTGTAGSGVVSPVMFTKAIINVDAVMNGGVFLCMKPGFYHFSGFFQMSVIFCQSLHDGELTHLKRNLSCIESENRKSQN